MSVVFSPLDRATKEYSFEMEERFRRDVENYLMRLSSAVNGATTRLAPEASLASKRDSFVSLPMGLTIV